MNDIKSFIVNNFKDDSINEIKESIDNSIDENIEEALPGLGVFFQIIWENASDKLKDELLNILKTHLN